MENEDNDKLKYNSNKIPIKESLKLIDVDGQNFENHGNLNKDIQNKNDIININNQEENINAQNKSKRSIKMRRYTLNSQFLSKNKTITEENNKKVSLYKKILHFLHEAFEHIIMQVFIIFLSIFSLFHEDIKILSLPKTVDYPFHHVNEFIFFFFLLEFIVFILSQKDFIGSFYFYLDIVSLISLIPEVHIIWDPILMLIEDDSSASKYLRLLKLINFIKVVRVAKVVAHTNQIEKQMEKKNSKIGLNVNTFSTNNLFKKKGIKINNDFNVNEIAIFLKYQKKTPIRSFKTTIYQNHKELQDKISKSNLPRLSTIKQNIMELSNEVNKQRNSKFKRKRNSINPSRLMPEIECGIIKDNLNNSYTKSNKIIDDLFIPERSKEKKSTNKYSDHNIIKIKRNLFNPNIKNQQSNQLKKPIKSNLTEKSDNKASLYSSSNSNLLNTINCKEDALIKESEKEKIHKYKNSCKFKLNPQFSYFNNKENKENEIAKNKYSNNLNNFNNAIQEVASNSASKENLFENLNNSDNNKTLSNNSSNIFDEKSYFRNVSIFPDNNNNNQKPLKDDFNRITNEKLENLISNPLRNSKVKIEKQTNDFYFDEKLLKEKKTEAENLIEIKEKNKNKNYKRIKSQTVIELSNTLNQENTDFYYNQNSKAIDDKKLYKIKNEINNENEIRLKTAIKESKLNLVNISNKTFEDKNALNNLKIINKEKPQLINFPSLKDTSKAQSDSNTSRSLSEISDDANDDLMDEEEEQRINERIKLFQSKMNLLKKQTNEFSSNKSLNNANQINFNKNYNKVNNEQRFQPCGPQIASMSKNCSKINCGMEQKLDGNPNDADTNLADQFNEKHYLKEIHNKANLKLDKKLTQNFTNRVILIIMVLLVALPIIDLDFMFDLLYTKEMQPNYKYFCLDLIYNSMNLSLTNPQEYLPFLNNTIETCFFGYGYLNNYTADKSEIKSFPQDLEFFLQLNFSGLDIYEQFDNQTHYFKTNYLELNYLKNYTQNLRLDIDYFDEIYSYNEKIKFVYYTNKVLFSQINSILSILKSFFVTLLLVFGTFLFTKDISLYVISPIEKLFAKLEIMFNSLDSLKEHLDLEEEIQPDKGKSGKNNKNNKHKNLKFTNKSLNKVEKNKEKNKKQNPKEETELIIINNFNSKNKNVKFNFLQSNTLDAKQTNEIVDNNNNNNENKRIFKKDKNQKNFKGSKIKKFKLEIDKVDFYIMKLLNLISVSLGNSLLMMIPNCDLAKELVIDLKSPAVNFEGFILMLNFSNKDNLIGKIGEKANKYFNKTISLFHSIGLIFCGHPYKIGDLDFLIWRKDKNAYLKNMFNYIQSLNEQNDSSNIAEIDSKILEKVLISEDLNSYLSDMVGNIGCMAGLKFINFFLKNLRKTIKVLSEAKVGLNLYCDYGSFTQGYGGSVKKMNEVIIGRPIFDFKKITEKISSTNPNYPSLFVSQNLLSFLEDDIKKNIILYDVIKKDNNCHIKVYRHFINYEMIQKEIKRINPSSSKIKDYLKKDKINKKSIIKENIDFIQNLKTEKNNFLFKISDDNVYIELTANLNPIYKNLMNLAIDSYLEKDFDNTRSIFEDISKLIKTTNDNNDNVFNEKINVWLKDLRNFYSSKNEFGKNKFLRNQTTKFH